MKACEIAVALKAKRSGESGWMARCVVPGHDDRTPSLHLTESADGKLLVNCHGGCEQEAVIAALKDRGLRINGSNGAVHSPAATRSISVQTSAAPTGTHGIPLAHRNLGAYSQHWDYKDAAGRHVLRICRWDREGGGKEIRPLALHASRWDWKGIERDRPLYRLPELLKSPRQRVLLLEGEKTAEAAVKLFPDVIATTWCGGAKATEKTDWQALRGRDVTLLADNDAPGAAVMDRLSTTLAALNCKVRRVDLSRLGELPAGWDVADGLEDQSFDVQALWELIEHAPIVHDKARAVSLRQAADIVSNPIPAAWLLRPYLEQMVLGLIFGELGTLKSFVALDMLLSIAAGRAWGGSQHKARPQPVVYVSAEGKGLGKRLQAWAMHHGADLRKLPFYAVEHALDLSNPTGILELVEAIESLDIKPAVIGIDTLSRNCGALDENSSADMGGFINALDMQLRQRFKCSVLLVHHTGHMEKGRARGSYSLMASTDAWFKIERPHPEELAIKFTTGRLKDSESPPAIMLRANVVDLGSTDKDGRPLTSLVLLPSDEPVAPPAPSSKPELAGKAQRQLLAALRAQNEPQRIWTLADLREVGRKAGMHKNTARSAAEALSCTPHLVASVGGWRVADG